MDTAFFRSPIGSESQDEWGSGLWMAGDLTPQALDEDIQQQQTNTESHSGNRSEAFPSPPASSSTEDAVVESNLGLTSTDSTTRDHEWPPVPAQAIMDQHSDSPEGSDSIVFLSEDSEEQGIDCKPLDFTSAREQWVRRDSNSTKPPTPAFSRSSSRGLITEELSPHTDPSIFHQQEEPDGQILAPDNEDQEVQQVCTPAPPLETVAGEQAANPDPVSPTCGALVVKEPLIEAAEGRREGDRESEQTDRERKQTVSGSGLVETRRESGTGDQGKGTSADVLQKARRMDKDQFEDSQSDSGVSADFSPSSTTEVSSTSIGCSSPDPNETPIEREIRLAIKREQSLRRARGLEPEEDKAKEFVEIPMRKSILSQELPLKSMQSEGKDRQFAGKKMQQEIKAEVEREKALVQLGRLPGFYDKGTVRQLREKKRIFEAFQEPKECLAILINRPSSSCEISNGGAQFPVMDKLPKERIRSLEFLDAEPDGGFTLTSTGHHGPGLIEGTKGQVIILESSPLSVVHTSDHVDKLADRSATVVDHSGGGRSFSVKPYSVGRIRNANCEDRHSRDDNDEESDTMKDNPFFKLRSSLSLRPDVQQDILDAREREKELRKQRTSLYGQGSEVDGTIFTTVTPSSNRTPAKSERPARTSVTGSTTPVRQSLGKLDLTWPPPQEEHKTQMEVQKSPKRHKSALLQRWENGLVNGHGEQQK
ncbi:hypothetical protein AMEX_G7364 [Astyanax mexicanus]|uniref:Si:ch211-207j7.2 n=1 Tax=Astyanax mexicanus TaxID=7994 RepID=A0A8B9LRR9_ASTMX|nr:hypothetical protein AMEX_G7364 [Astyanax mexicanus]